MENNPNPNSDKFDELIKTYGKRIQPDELMQRRALNKVKAHWQESLKNQRSHRNKNIFRIAATLMIMVTSGLFFKFSLMENSLAPFSDSFYVQGELMVSSDGENWQLNNQMSIESGKWLKTGKNSYASLNLSDGGQLRINQDSKIEIVDLSEVRLLSGGVYHDADNSFALKPLKIKTTFADIQHIGTRYLVNIDGDGLHVAVRNGLIGINSNNVTRQLSKGKQLNISEFGQEETSVSPHDEIWSWATIAGNAFSTDGKSLYDFVMWYAHENGYKINWNNQQFNTRKVMLSGKLTKLSQIQQIKTVFLSTKYNYEINQGILSIF